MLKGDAAMTPLLIVKLFRDLRTIRPRIVLMILAMSFTLIVFSGVFYTRGITGREIPRALCSSSPAAGGPAFDVIGYLRHSRFAA